MLRNVVFLVLITFSASCLSAGSYSGKITRVMLGPQYGNNVFLSVDGAIANRPSCATNSGYGFVFDGSTAVGKNTLSIVLSLYVSGKTVNIGGAGRCEHFSNVESVNWVRGQ